MTTRIDTAHIESPEALLKAMGVFDNDLGRYRTLKKGQPTPDQKMFALKSRIECDMEQHAFDVDGNHCELFHVKLSDTYTRWLIPANAQLVGVCSVYAWSDGIQQRRAISPTMCADPYLRMYEIDWVVVDVHNETGNASVLLGDWDHSLNEFVNATRKELAALAKAQLVEEHSVEAIDKLRTVVQQERNAKLEKLDAEYQHKRQQLIAQWNQPLADLIEAEDEMFRAENSNLAEYRYEITRGHAEVPPKKPGNSTNAVALMESYRRGPAVPLPAILWRTVKEKKPGGYQNHVEKYAKYDHTRSVWTLI